MGQKFLIQGGNFKKVSQIPIEVEKYTMLGQVDDSPQQIVTIGNSLGIDWSTISQDELARGTKHEAQEHQDVMNGNLEVAVRIAYAHLREMPNYYQLLEQMERDNTTPNTDGNVQNASGGTEY